MARQRGLDNRVITFGGKAERKAAQNRAYVYLNRMKKLGKVAPQCCFVCKAPPTRNFPATTDRVRPAWKDYSKPLEITWLCHRCRVEKWGDIKERKVEDHDKAYEEALAEFDRAYAPLTSTQGSNANRRRSW